VTPSAIRQLGIEYDTLHLHADDVPFVTFQGATKTRVLHARPDEGFVVTQILAPPGDKSALHQHNGPVFGWTNRGTWGHDDRFEYRPGTYIFETPGVPHRFHAGPDEVDAVFVSFGTLDMLDPQSGDVVATLTAASALEAYLQGCEAAGLPRPNVLG
jgi:2,4'-dihydroxyacetophenone dioxygenase